jgi:hypothetical protein
MSGEHGGSRGAEQHQYLAATHDQTCLSIIIIHALLL